MVRTRACAASNHEAHPSRRAEFIIGRSFVPRAVTKTGQREIRFSREYRELANLASFLVSDSAGYINGEMVVQDCGAHLRSSGAEDLLAWTVRSGRSSGWRARKTGREGRTEGEAGPGRCFRGDRNCLPNQTLPGYPSVVTMRCRAIFQSQ
jgi:hypothetical protein